MAGLRAQITDRQGLRTPVACGVLTKPALTAFVCLIMLATGLRAQKPTEISPSTFQEQFADVERGGMTGEQPGSTSLHFAEHGSAQEPRYSPFGHGHIVIGDPAEDPYIPAFVSDDPHSLFYRHRPNLFNQAVDDEWDFYNLINTDRPDFTDAPYSAGEGVTIIETGYTFRSIADGTQHVTRQTLPESLVRLGLTNEFELRLKWNGLVAQQTKDVASGASQQVFGGDDLIVGFKYELLQQDKIAPMVTFVGGTTVPSGTNGVSANTVQPFANLVLGWGFSRWLYLKYSGGVDWGNGSSSTFVPNGAEFVGGIPTGTFETSRDDLNLFHNSLSLLYQATKRVGGFVEWFALASTGAEDNRAAHYADAGFYIYAATNIQFDIRYGRRLSDRVEESFTGAGLSVRY